MSHIYTNLYPVKITCERNATFQSLWSRVFSEIQYSQTVQGIGFNAEKRTELVDIAALYHNNTCGNEIANVIEVLKNSHYTNFYSFLMNLIELIMSR